MHVRTRGSRTVCWVAGTPWTQERASESAESTVQWNDSALCQELPKVLNQGIYALNHIGILILLRYIPLLKTFRSSGLFPVQSPNKHCEHPNLCHATSVPTEATSFLRKNKLSLHLSLYMPKTNSLCISLSTCTRSARTK